MDASEDFESLFNSVDEESMTEILDTAQEVTEIDRGKDVSIAEHHHQPKDEASDPQKGPATQIAMKSDAIRPALTKTVYMDLQCDSPGKDTVKLMDHTGHCMLTPESPERFLVQEIRSGKPEELLKLIKHHLIKLELGALFPFNAMLLVVQGATSLLQNFTANSFRSSSLPFGIKGLKAIDHKQMLAPLGSQTDAKSRLSRTTIEDRTSELLKERRIRELHFHTDSSKHDWQCFIDLDGSVHKEQFGNSGPSVFDHIIAAAIEIFEHGQAERRWRPSRPGHETQSHVEVIARAKYLENVSSTSIPVEDWNKHLAEMWDRTSTGKTPLLVLPRDASASDIFGALDKKCAARGQEQRPCVQANVDTTGRGTADPADIGPGMDPITDEVKDQDNVTDDSGSRLTASVDEDDILDETSTNASNLSAKGQKKNKGKGRPKKRKTRSSLMSKPAARITEENDVVPLTKSGSSSSSDENPLVNTGGTPDPALHPTHGEVRSRSSSCHTNISDHTVSVPAEAAEMNDLRRIKPATALGGDDEHLDVVESQRKDSTGEAEGEGWQTVAHGKNRKSSGKNQEPSTPPPRRGAPPAIPPATTRLSTTPTARRTQASFSPKAFSTIRLSPTASTTPTFNEQEFPDLPRSTQSEEAAQKVMAKKQENKDKRKKKKSALEGESSQSSNALLGEIPAANTTKADQLMTANIHSNSSGKPLQDESEEPQDSSSDEAIGVTDEDITPNASMINLKAARASQASSASAPPSTSLGVAGSMSTTQSVNAIEAKATSAPRSTSTSQFGSTATSQSVSADGAGSTSARPPTSASQVRSASTQQSHGAWPSGSTSTGPMINPGELNVVSPQLAATTPSRPWTHKFGAFEGPTRIVCRLPSCDITTSPWDGRTVICPGCGPYSSIRYCCIDHLLADLTDHWGVDCMKYSCNHLCDASTIHPRQVSCPPIIPNICGWNTPERHRQAVYHAHSSKKNGFAEIEGDYFIFSDAEQWIQAGAPPMPAWGIRRARGELLVVVTFEDDAWPNSLKDRFNRLLNAALFTAASNALLLNYLFLMIRENLISKDEWDDEILDSVVFQFQYEFCYEVPDWITNNKRHACPHQWFGTPVDQCRDRVCNGEMLHPVTRRPMLPRLAIKEKTDELERRYWILRVARVYHPNIPDQGARMRGVGFDFVPPENRRMYCMGREWEGYPSGTMEIEGAIWVNTVGGPRCLQAADLMTLTV